jgi:hypothetical protein
MPIPVYAVWFPEKQTIIISGGDSGDADFFNEWEAVDRLGPRASGVRRRFWRLPKGRAASVPVHPGSRYELFKTSDKSSIPFTIDAGFSQDTSLIFALYSNESTADGATQCRFLVNDGNWSNVLELYDRLQNVIDPDVRSKIHGIWYSPVSYVNEEIRVGPARAIALPRERQTIEVLPASVSGAMSKIELIANAIGLATSGGGVAATPTAILLVWRSIFAERLKTTGSNPLLQAFHDNVEKFLGQSIAFSRAPATASAVTQRPIARGYFSLRANPVHKDGASSVWAFEGPLEVRDVLVLCVPSLPGQPVELRYGRDSRHSPHKSSQEGFEVSILCWRADIDELTPVAWNDLDAHTQAVLADQLTDELRKLQGAAESRQPQNRDGEASDHREAEELAVARTPRAPALEYSKVFAADEELRGTIDEWFATLSTEEVEKLSARDGPALPITNIARFLPVALADSSTSWTELERDASILHARVAGLVSLLKLSTTPGEHFRGDARIWKSIDRTIDAVGLADDGELVKAVQSFAPDASGALAVLKPGALGSAIPLLDKLEATLQKIFQEAADTPNA